MNATLSIQKFKQTPHFNGIKHKNFLISSSSFSSLIPHFLGVSPDLTFPPDEPTLKSPNFYIIN